MTGCWRLGRRPGLDGLRGLAVISVLIGHALQKGTVNWFSASGVDLFFVLSGFLITSLLLEELADSGRVSVRRFYLRRARRLVPALLVMIAFVVVVGLMVPGYGNGPMLVGALTWSANWVKISQWHHAGPEFGSPLGHTWSLSVEEQFYLVWPLLLVLLSRFGRRALVIGTVAGLGTAAAIPLFTSDPAHLYYGSDTRAMPLLAGCLLALWMHRRPVGAARPALAAAGLVWIDPPDRDPRVRVRLRASSRRCWRRSRSSGQPCRTAALASSRPGG